MSCRGLCSWGGAGNFGSGPWYASLGEAIAAFQIQDLAVSGLWTPLIFASQIASGEPAVISDYLLANFGVHACATMQRSLLQGVPEPRSATAANFMFLTGTFWILPLTYSYILKSVRAYLFPESIKIPNFCSVSFDCHQTKTVRQRLIRRRTCKESEIRVGGIEPVQKSLRMRNSPMYTLSENDYRVCR